MVENRQIVLLGQGAGETTVHLWMKDGSETSFRVNIHSEDIERIRKEVQTLMQDHPEIQVRALGNKVLLEGVYRVAGVAARVRSVLTKYPDVLNLVQDDLPAVKPIRMDPMIHLDLRVVEVRKRALDQLGIKWANSAEGPMFATSVLGYSNAPWAAQSKPGYPAVNTNRPAVGYLGLASQITSALQFLEQSGDSWTLAEPRLSCKSGGKSKFVAGGEIPIPVSMGLGQTSVVYKQYGVVIEFNPVSDAEGNIESSIEVEVSEPDPRNSNQGFVAFTSDQTVLGIIERIVAPVGRRIDESSPMVDARLKDGSRVNAVIPPLALKGPSLTIRKFSKRKLGAEDLLKFASASPEMIDFLRVCVKHNKNIIISGGTGSGKTTLLNILSNFIPEGDRIVSIEDAAELQLHHPNLVSMESRPANLEGKGQITIRELVKNALRMRPDRIVVGECRGGEALDMLQAMNTGHDGSLTTAHANTPRDMLSRLEVMVLMAGMDLPVAAIREQVSSAVDVIVQQSRLTCGARKITSIVEVTGIESGKIQLQEIFAYVQEGFDEHGKTLGHFTGRGCVPEFYETLAARGVALDMGIFSPGSRSPLKRAA